MPGRKPGQRGTGRRFPPTDPFNPTPPLNMAKITWSDIEDTLPEDSECGSAAEAHGLLSGLLCMDGGADSSRWLELTLGPDAEPLDPVASSVWQQLFKETRRQLEDFDFSFTPLLPDDDDGTLEERADALGEWCRGFLLGLGYGSNVSDWPGECTEILRDFAEITQLDPASSGDSETDETAYAELAEYVRVGVQVVQRELKARPSQPIRLH
ncbi:hypothetical protein SAMN02949497_3821 [Methylomagnum ishizawai]|uniref:YecA family protein n=2 Tax=Methylomagnum ishizawai TaxID=1760988 RepID=A0A1Y6D834_9GAMM|nr:hypothetical protein SAMN02949497_3821 [Methylomagnum ishizawai]